MADNKIKANQLRPDQTVLLRGKLNFSVLTCFIDGEELRKSDERLVQMRMNPIGKPHTTVTLHHSEVVPAVPGQHTPEEEFVSERRYLNPNKPERGHSYTVNSKGRSLPTIQIPNEETGQHEQDLSGKDLAQGLDVTLVLRSYAVKTQANRGFSLDHVIVNEPVRYYESGAARNMADLANRGITFAAPPVAVRPGDAPATADAPVGAPAEAGNFIPADTVINEQGFALPAPPASMQPMVAVHPVVAPQPTVVPQSQPAAFATPAVQPVAQQPVAPVQEESLEAKAERLERELAAVKNQGSAVGAPTTPWPGVPASPAGISYQG